MHAAWWPDPDSGWADVAMGQAGQTARWLHRIALHKAWHRLRWSRHTARLHRIHTRMRRTLVGPVDKGLHRVCGAGGLGFDAAIAAVAHPALQAALLGGLHHGPAVAHALHVAADEEVLGDVGVGVHGRTVSRAQRGVAALDWVGAAR